MIARRSILVAPALAASVLASLLAAGPGAATEEASDRYTRDCRHELNGVPVRIQLTVQFASTGSNDIKKVSVRASDDREKGAFKNASAQFTSGLVKINGPDDQATTLNKSFKSSPYSTNVGPRSNGKNAARVTTIVTWDMPKKRKASMSCFYVDG